MGYGSTTAQQIQPLDFSLLNPGLIAGGGINQSSSRFGISQLQAWNILNLEPVRRGFSNKGNGMTRLNSNRPIVGKIQALFTFKNKICFVAGGNMYQMNITGGIATVVAGGTAAFDANAKVRYAYNRGNSVDKVYLCDGVNDGQYWDGSNLADVAGLSAISGYTVPDKVYTWRGRTVWGFVPGSVNENRLAISKVSDGDNYNFAATSVIDALDTEVSPGDGDYINGIGVIKIKGETDQTEVLVACKTKQAYQADDINFAGTTVSAVFNRIGVDIECLNPDCVIPFLNDLWILGRTGIKGFTAVSKQDGIAALVQSASLPVDNLIINGAESSAFENTFMTHFATLRKIWIFLPKSSQSSTIQNNFVYPEIPNDFTICYNYGITNIGGNIVNAWYTRGGPGWAIAAAAENGDEVLVGTYFGDIYRITPGSGGDNYEPEVSLFGANYYDTQGNIVANPTVVQTNQPICSEWETGDWTFGDYNLEKFLEEYRALVYVGRRARMNFEVFFNGSDSGITYLDKLSRLGGNTNVAIWDVGKWDVNLWAGETATFTRIRPVGHGRSVRIKTWFCSRILNDEATSYNANHVTIYGLSGRVQVGGEVID